jgi:hypothetical protein
LTKIRDKKCLNCEEICQYFFNDFLVNISNLESKKIDQIIKIIAEKYPDKLLSILNELKLV